MRTKLLQQGNIRKILFNVLQFQHKHCQRKSCIFTLGKVEHCILFQFLTRKTMSKILKWPSCQTFLLFTFKVQINVTFNQSLKHQFMALHCRPNLHVLERYSQAKVPMPSSYVKTCLITETYLKSLGCLWRAQPFLLTNQLLSKLKTSLLINLTQTIFQLFLQQ